MAKGKIPPTAFVPGDPRAVAAGKKSSRALPPDLKEARAMNAIKFEDTVYKYMDSSIEQLKELIKIEQLPARDLIVLKILIKAYENGDQARLGFLLDRTVGKTPENINISRVKTLHEQIVDALEADKKENE